MKTAVIIGHKGQDGQIAFEYLKQRGYKVLGVDIERINSYGLEVNQKVNIEDINQVTSLLCRLNPDELYYFAAYHGSSQDFLERNQDAVYKSQMVHVLGVRNCLEVIQKNSLKTRVLYASSSLIFEGTNTVMQDEMTSFCPKSLYANSKLEGLLLCREYRMKHGLFVCVAILYNHESCFRSEGFVSKKIVNSVIAIKQGVQEKLVLGDLNAQADWGYAPDYVEAMHKILNVSVADDFIVSTGQLHSVRDFADVAFSYFGLDYRQHVQEDSSIISQKRNPLVGNSQKLRSVTGWQPSVDFENMVKALLKCQLKTLVFVPTYNERGNVQELVSRILALKVPLDVLFIDDNSSDGTGQLLNEMANRFQCLKVIHRPSKNGIGDAHRAGIEWAYQQGYQNLITLDGDLTHPPETIYSLLDYSDAYDVVIASRYLVEDGLQNWSLYRRALSGFGVFMVRVFLGLKYDATGAFRLYRLDKIPRNLFYLVRSSSYSFFYESLFVLNHNNFKMKEVPVKLQARVAGYSKMCVKEVWPSIKCFLGMLFVRCFNSSKISL